MSNLNLKVLTIGESGVGKTCLLLRLADNVFNSNHITTIGSDLKHKTFYINDKESSLQIWDTAGQERYRTLSKIYYKGAHGIVVTYDVSDENSFKNIKLWIKQIEINAPSNVVKILVGNKSDRSDRKISYQDGQKLAEAYKMPFFETSAKTGHNVVEAFYALTVEMIKTILPKEINENSKIRLSLGGEKKKGSCC